MSVDRPHLSSDELDLLVRRFRAGDAAAAAQLLEHFDRYLEKWFTLLTAGRFARRDDEVKHFLRMLLGSDDPQAGHRLARQMRAYEPSDVKQELQLLLLETAAKHGRITGHFRYQLKARAEEMLRDPLVFKRPSDRLPEAPAPPRALDERWIRGEDCGPGFSELTEQQRQIVRLVYWCGYPQEQIVPLVGLSLRTLQRELARIKEVLGKHYL